MIRMRLTYTNFAQVFGLCKKNPIVGTVLGYICQAHMTPESFIKMNEIELIDEN